MSTPEPEKKRGRIRQLFEAYRVTRTVDPAIGWILLGIVLGAVAIGVVLGLIVQPLWFWIVIGLMAGLLVAMIVFGRRAESAAYSRIEGQPGAATAALNTLPKGYFTTPAVAVNRQQDFVHRVLGPPGIVLVGEGTSAGRAGALVATEKKRTARFVPDLPITELVVGDGEGEVPLRKLARRVRKLPRALRPAEVTDVRRRLDALTATPLPIPKGPLPKGGKPPRPKVR